MYIADKSKYNSLEDILDVITDNGKLQYAEIGNKERDYSSILNRYKFFKEYIRSNFPELTTEEVLKFYKIYHDFGEKLHGWNGVNYFMTFLEFENSK